MIMTLHYDTPVLFLKGCVFFYFFTCTTCVGAISMLRLST